MINQRFGSYVAVRKLGEGGMGAVYEAVHEEIGRRAAVKVLHPGLSLNPELSGRFLNEARAVNIVQHAGVVGIFEFGRTPEGAAFLVMEYLEGESLRQRLDRQGTLALPEALRVLRQMALALAAAHGKGIVHRDLKPENVMLVPEPEIAGGERVKILDFGIAKVASEAQRQGGVVTRFGAMLGTPVYMSPEQCMGAQAVDERTDVYALGVMLYELLSGAPPFDSESVVAILAKHMHAPPRPLREAKPGVPEAVSALVGRMLAKDPAARPTMAEVARAAETLGAARTGTAAPVAAPAFLVHRARGCVERNWTNLDHPQLNGHPEALLLITPCVADPGKGAAKDGHHVGVWYTPRGRWAVYHEDRQPMSEEAAFHAVVPGQGLDAFVHRAEAGNIFNNWSVIDHPAANGRPDALILLTANWNPDGRGGMYNDHALGVWYTNGRWAVFNQDRAPMPEGAAWNVIVAERGFVHRVAPGNVLGRNGTTLSHPSADGRPDAIVLVTPSWNPGGRGGAYHDHPIALTYTGDRWALLNLDQAPMTIGAAFNVWVAYAARG